MIPTIETIVEDLLAGTITKQLAIAWLYRHAEDAGQDMRSQFAAMAMQGLCADPNNNDCTAPHIASMAVECADALIAELNKAQS